ncbi:hypothetical protein [Pontibacillus sp. HMF3514]|uniref:hypothetical protein n=1 Tax=Pontibacillus sp. HMF3514 TaxID=2692425 RepID=UPI00131FC1F8|nr:hypothetical protein [Pontibacillus sp. HMF3514]QHE51924.1 hypothetical protein GS400_07725 [Pontibacillus sp. HMF3514]
MIRIPQRLLFGVALILFTTISIGLLIRSQEAVMPKELAVSVSEPLKLPHKITMVETVDELEQKVGFDVKTLKEPPMTYIRTYIGYQQLDEGLLVRQTFLNRNEEILTLKQSNDKELLDRANTFDKKEDLVVNGRSYTIFMNGSDIFQVIWEEPPFSYSLTSQQTFSLEEWKYLLSVLK